MKNYVPLTIPSVLISRNLLMGLLLAFLISNKLANRTIRTCQQQVSIENLIGF